MSYERGALLFELKIPRPVKWITLNEVSTRTTWQVGYKLKKAWGEATMVMANNQKVPHRVVPLQCDAVIVVCTYVFNTNRTRDPDNFVPTRKSIIDHLTKQHRCWPDDNPKYLTLTPPELVYRKGSTEGVILRCYERIEM